ncbi:MAG TPA: alpha/beta hydrolase [Usitatibacter sp.]|nr:alpha/beta hydrolase [Usitatibacter sp.]
MARPQDVIARNNVRVFGKGTQPIVFAHGFGCDQNMWRLITPAFQNDYRIVLFDYVGCGKSDWSAYSADRYGTLQGYVQDVIEVIRALGMEKVVFVGHSVSSVVGLLASIQAPELFERLVLIGPSPRYVNDGEYVGGFERADIEGLLDLMEKNYVGWAQFLAPVVMKNGEQPELSRELEASFCSTDPRVTRQFARATFLSDNRADLEKVRVPALVLQCSEDAIAPVQVGEYVHRALKGSSYRQMAATGHCPHMSHPQETITLMKEFLSTSPR